jgi:hypothetical protein
VPGHAGPPQRLRRLAGTTGEPALSGLDVETADYFSRSLGQATRQTPRRSWQKKRFTLFAGGVTDTVQDHARPLLTPDEVRRIGSGEALAIIGNRRPIRLDKFVYALAPQAAQTACLGPARAMPLSLPPRSELAPRQRRTPDRGTADDDLPPTFPEELQASIPAKHAGARFSRRRPSGHRQTTWVSRPAPHPK